MLSIIILVFYVQKCNAINCLCLSGQSESYPFLRRGNFVSLSNLLMCR